MGNSSKGGAFLFDDQSLGTLTNCLLHANSAEYGSAIFAKSDYLFLNNCTVAENTADVAAGGVYHNRADSEIVLNNTILWGNTDDGSSVLDAQITII